MRNENIENQNKINELYEIIDNITNENNHKIDELYVITKNITNENNNKIDELYIITKNITNENKNQIKELYVIIDNITNENNNTINELYGLIENKTNEDQNKSNELYIIIDNITNENIENQNQIKELYELIENITNENNNKIDELYIITENITNENQNQIKELYVIIDNITNENIENQNKIDELYVIIDNMSNKDIKELKNEIKILESFHFVNYINEDKVQLTKSSLKNITSIYPHTQSINSMSLISDNNIISVSGDKSIIIYDNNLNVLKNISNAHNSNINYVYVKDDNNFATCSNDKKIKIWKKIGDTFQIDKIIERDNIVNKIMYLSNGNIIECSNSNINILELRDNTYQINNNIFTHTNEIKSFLYLEDKNILITSGIDGTKIWNFTDNSLITYFAEVICKSTYCLNKLDDDTFIVGYLNLYIISISEKNIIKEINIPFISNGILYIESKGIILIGGISKDIKVYRSDNFECIQTIEDAHEFSINGFIELFDGSIVSFSSDGKMMVWIF